MMSTLDVNPTATLSNKASQDTFISLLQLDPQPMDNDKELPPLPEESTTLIAGSSTGGNGDHVPTSRSNPLGLSHSPIYYLQRIQRYSSYTFTLFASLHLATTSLVPLTNRYLLLPASTPPLAVLSYSDSALLAAREIYQAPLTEPLLIGVPLLAHIASGVAIRLLRRRQNLKRYGGATPGVWALTRRPKQEAAREGEKNGGQIVGTAAEAAPKHVSHTQHIWPTLSYISLSGYLLYPLVTAHIYVNRIVPLQKSGDSSAVGLSYVAHGFSRHGAVLRIGAWLFYATLIAAASGHIVWGWARWLGIDAAVLGSGPEGAGGPGAGPADAETRTRRKHSWWNVMGVAIGVSLLWVAGGLGIVARAGKTDGWIGQVYDGLYEAAGL